MIANGYLDPAVRVLYIKASSGKVCDAQLSIAGERIQEVGDSEFKFLGMHIFESLVTKWLQESPSKHLKSLVSHLLDQPQQGRMMSLFDGSMAALWARCVGRLPPDPLRFILNATLKTLPTNSKLYVWGKRSSATCPLCQ